MGKEQNEQIEQEEEFEVSNFLRQDLPIEIVESNLLSILLNTGSQELFFKAHEKITLNHFSNAFHSRIYKYIYNMVIVDSSPIDKALIASKIRQQGQRKQYDKIIGEKPPVEHFDYYLVAIDKDFKIRRFKEIIFQRSTNFYEDKEIDVNLEIERLESDILAMVSSNQSSVLSMGDIVPEVLASIRSKKFLAELEFPLVRINEMLYGVQPCYYIIAARPSMGKSLMSLDIALHNVEKGHKGLFFSLEMPKDSIIKRAIARAAKIPHFRIRKGDLTDEEVSLIEKAGNRIKSYPLHIDDTAGLSASEIVARTKRFAIRNPDLKFVMVDYMQIVSESGSGGGTREREVSKISAAFKTLSKNMGIPVIVLSQLSREVEKRQDKRPILSDLRDCLAVDTSYVYTKNGMKQNSSEDMDLLCLNSNANTIENAQSFNIPKTENIVFRLKTKTGRFIDCTENHNILTTSGYKKLKDISKIDSIAVARLWGENEGVYISESRFVGWMLGNGSMIEHRTPSFITGDKEIANDFVEFIQRKFSFSPRILLHHKSKVFQYTLAKYNVRTSEGNPVTDWLKEHALWGQIHFNKSLPDWFMENANHQSIKELIQGLWETDGSITDGEKHKNIQYSTTSLKLANQIIYLLAKIGVVANISDGFTSKVAKRPCYKVIIDSCEEKSKFQSIISLRGNKGTILRDAVYSSWSYQRNTDKINRDTTIEIYNILKTVRKKSWEDRVQIHGSRRLTRKKFAELYFKYKELLIDYEWILSPNIFWDAVASIEELGTTAVFDRSVPFANNYVVNGIIVHNSGSVEQDADVVMFLYSDNYYNNREANIWTTEIILAKHRNGQTGTVLAYSLQDYQTFAEHNGNI